MSCIFLLPSCCLCSHTHPISFPSQLTPIGCHEDRWNSLSCSCSWLLVTMGLLTIRHWWVQTSTFLLLLCLLQSSINIVSFSYFLNVFFSWLAEVRRELRKRSLDLKNVFVHWNQGTQKYCLETTHSESFRCWGIIKQSSKLLNSPEDIFVVSGKKS